jgi:hypothetical protein
MTPIITTTGNSRFDLATALFCGGLAFDAYVEPAANSSRWERGSQGVDVAFCSSSFTRNLYQGLIEVTVQKVTGLPATHQDESVAERLLSGAGVDACLLVAVIEGQWKEDIERLEKEIYHTGILDLSGAAHVSRSSTCWSTVTEQKAIASQKKNGRPLPYHVQATWTQGAQAVWPETEPPFYLYVQDPTTARLVFTVLDDDKLGSGKAVGSTYRKLADLIPQAGLKPHALIESLKDKIIAEIQKSGQGMDALDETTKFQLGATTWTGQLKLTSKPRKRDKNSQILAGAAAGAYLGGPVGALGGAALAAMYEGNIQGSVSCKIRYLPIPTLSVPRKTYRVLGGMPGIDWGTLYQKYLENKSPLNEPSNSQSASKALLNEGPIDLEHCFFVTHQKTGATCAVYRSLHQKLIIVSFRGTCAPIDLITDVTLVQDAWVEGEDVNDPNIAKVQAGFRSSLNSIARRLKELILATPAPGEDISQYDVLVTGHSLGGALATLFTADIGQYGIDAGRALPQLVDSEPWWKSIINTFSGQKEINWDDFREPPRPKSLLMYNFGSPRVGNVAFAELFDALTDEGMISEAFRIVNGEDVVARLPRTVNAFVLGSVGYEHVGTTVLLSRPEMASDGANATTQSSVIWIEGESDNNACPVRDGLPLTSPLAEGTLLSDLLSATRDSFSSDLNDDSKELSWSERLQTVAEKVTERIKNIQASDLASVLGIDQSFTDREFRIIQSLVQGKALAHHLEDEYYAGMGLASGFVAKVGEDLVVLDTSRRNFVPENSEEGTAVA